MTKPKKPRKIPRPTNIDQHAPPSTQVAEEKVMSVIKRLSTLCDPVGLRVHLVEESKYGTRPHPDDTWGYTRDYMTHYGDPADTDQVISLFEEAGCPNEHEAGRWLLRYDNLIP